MGSESGNGTLDTVAKIFTGGLPTGTSLLVPKTPETPPPPALEKVTEMPDPEAQQAAITESIREQIGRRGRASTILTDQSETLG